MDHDSTTATSRRQGRSRAALPVLLWSAHALLVLGAGGYAALAALAGSTDANIGLGLGLLGLGVLGLPWTLPLLWIDGTSLDSHGAVAWLVGGALLNLGLHAAAWRWWSRARASRRRRG